MIRLYEEFENSTPPPPQLPKIEAIQTSLFVDVPDVLGTVLFEMPQRRSQNLPLDDPLTPPPLDEPPTPSRASERLY